MATKEPTPAPEEMHWCSTCRYEHEKHGEPPCLKCFGYTTITPVKPYAYKNWRTKHKGRK